MRSIDFAIITGLPEEFKGLKQAIPGLVEEPDERQGDLWYRGRIESKRGYGYALVATFQKDMGPVPATLLTQRVIERWDPAHIILVGLAGSFTKEVRRGWRMLRAGLDGFSAEDVLTLEVMSRIKYGRAKNIDDLVDGLIRNFGSAEDAVVALKSGLVHFKKVKVDGDDAPDAAPERLMM